MNIKKSIAIYMILSIVITLFIVNKETINVYGAENVQDINIISNTDVLPECAKEWARRRGATTTFINLADLYFKYSKDHGQVNPAIAYAQSALETGYGRYGSVLGEECKNPCGMKQTQGGGDYDASIHMRFASWDDGVTAHLDHLALYAGAKGYPKKNTKDPRHFKELYNKCSTVRSLGGCYAPSLTYGDSVLNLYNSLVQVDKEYRPYVIANLPIVASIDSIDTSNMLENKTIKVSGYAISGKNIKSLSLFIGDKLKATFNCDVNRQDLKSSYPLYNTQNSGFNIDVDISDIEAKEQEVKLVVCDVSGKKYETSKNFILEKKPPLTMEQLKQIENMVYFNLDDNIYKEYIQYTVYKTSTIKNINLIKMICRIKNVLDTSGYNIIVKNTEFENDYIYSDDIKEKAEFNICNNCISNDTIDFNNMDNNYINDGKGKIYFAIFDNIQDNYIYNKICEDIVRDFINSDNNVIKSRQNKYKLINSKISTIDINYDIKRKNTFNDNLDDDSNESINKKINNNPFDSTGRN